MIDHKLKFLKHPNSMKREFCFLFQLSKYIAVPILVEWLWSKDLRNFDTALCNHENRELYLSWCLELKKMFQKVYFQPCPRLSISNIKWCFKREFDLQTVFKSVTLFADDARHLSKNLNNLLHLKILVSITSLSIENSTAWRNCSPIERIAQDIKYVSMMSKLRKLKQFKSIVVIECEISPKELDYEVNRVSTCNFDYALLVRHCVQLKVLKFEDCNAEQLMAICIHASNLESLQCKYTPKANWSIFGMHSRCNLHTLHNREELADVEVRCLVSYKGKRLTSLDIVFFDISNAADIIGVCSPQLKALSLMRCRWSFRYARNLEVLTNIDTGLAAMFCHWKYLTNVELRIEETNNIDAVLYGITENCFHLQQLSITKCLMSAEALATIGNCINLTKLSLFSMFSLNDEALANIVSKCSKLNILQVLNCYDHPYELLSNESLIAVSQAHHKYHKLKTFKFDYDDPITKVNIAALRSSCPLLDAYFFGPGQQYCEFENETHSPEYFGGLSCYPLCKL